MAGDEQERHLPATERQRERFAERGEVARSRDLSSALILCAGVGGAYACLLEASTRLRVLIQEDFSRIGNGLRTPMYAAHLQTVGAIVSPILLACVLGTLASAALQSGGRFRLVPIEFKLERLSPLSRLMQIFSVGSAGKQIAWAVLKLTLVGLIAWKTLSASLPVQLMSYPTSLLAALESYASVIGALVLRCLGALLALGAIDYGVNWWQLEKRMRMSHAEVREEAKQDMGDPRARGYRRRKHRELIKRSSVLAAKRAHVVLVNPTHYAVALRYDAQTMRAPVVVAKGADQAAERIRRVAREHNVPIVSEPPLTRTLFARVGVNKAVPQDLYHAVALVLAHVYGLRRSA